MFVAYRHLTLLGVVTLASALNGSLLAAVDARGLLGAHGTLSTLCNKSIFDGLLLDLFVGEVGQLLGSVDVGNLLDETLGEDDVDFLERAVGSLKGFC